MKYYLTVNFCLFLTYSLFAQIPIGQVKSHLKISATSSSFSGTLDSYDQFGINVTGLGDLDGDGFEDIAVTANSDDDGGLNKGAVWVLFLHKGVDVKSYQKISIGNGNFTGNLDERFGSSIDNIGDLDGDGVTDLIVGETRCNDGGLRNGAVWILFLNTDGTVKTHQKISEWHGNFTGNLWTSGQFGANVAGIGDLDNDGVLDVAVASTFDGDGGQETGSVWILFLNTDGTVKSHQKISASQGNFTGTLEAFDRFGTSICSAGDFDKDGINDLLITARGDDDGVTDAGAVWLTYLNADGTVKAWDKISATQGNFTGLLSPVDHFGISIDTIGDLDGNQVVDFAVGAYFDDDGGTDAGAVWILFMENDGTIKSFQKISNTQGNFSGQLQSGDAFGGWGVSVIGDFNDDGFNDIVVGSYGVDDGGTNTGAAWILNLQGQFPVSASPNLKKIDIHIYPNPNRGQFTIANIPSEKAMVKVWTLDGKLVHNLEIQTYQTEVEFFVEHAGGYLVEVIVNEQRFVKKVIVQK